MGNPPKTRGLFAHAEKKLYLCARIESDEAQEVASPRACRAVSKEKVRAEGAKRAPRKKPFYHTNHTSHVRNRRDQRSSV